MQKITERLLRAIHHLGGAAIAVAVMATAAPVAAQDAPPWPSFIDADQLDESVPTPESVIGFAAGDDAVRYEALVRYLHALAEASPFVTITPHGETHEGRTLYHLTITSVENHARLDQIRADNARLADPRKLTDAKEGERIVDELPGIAWLAYSIHGDETSPCDSAVMIAYLLAAGTDEKTTALRNELVINIDPLQNPDGRERFLSQIQTMRGEVPNPDVQAMHHAGLWSAGRGNHYLFDMNRDWLMQTQPETRGRAAAILTWHPHLVVDAHEMGSMDTYLFDPPREPINENLAPSVLNWRRKMSADQAAAFNAYGWSYYTKEWYDEWYPGYTNAWTSLIGAAALLYEQAGVNGDAVTKATGDVFTYRQAVRQNVVSTFANLETLRANRKAIVADFLADRQWAVSGEGPFHETFLFPPSADRSRRQRLLHLLDLHGIEYEITGEPVDAEDLVDIWGAHSESVTLPAGTAVVHSAQPHRRLMHAILGFDPHLTDEFLQEERHDLENGLGTRMYDAGAWNLPMAYGLESYMAARVAAVTPADPDKNEPGTGVQRRGAFGYLIPIDDSDVYRALARLFAEGCKVRVGRKPFTHNGRAFARGAILLRNNENPSRLVQILQKATSDLGIEVIAVNTALSDEGPDLGGRSFVLLHEPRIAIASQWPTSTSSFGSSWYMLDHRIGLRASPINIQRLGRMDLRKYNVLIIPSSYNLRGVLGDGGTRRLRTWIEGGGTLIAIGGSASYLASESSGLSSVRLRRDVLDELDVYEEYVQREIAARKVTVDPEAVWTNGPPAAAEDDDEENRAPRGDLDSLKRADAWARTFAPRGTIVAGSLNPQHWLTYGLGGRLPLLVSGSSVFMAKPPAAAPVRLGDVEHLRLSGLLWPEARPRLAHSAFATVERLGNGQVILFAHEPFQRAYWEGTGRLLLNAVILGPGMGASQPLPW